MLFQHTLSDTFVYAKVGGIETYCYLNVSNVDGADINEMAFRVDFAEIIAEIRFTRAPYSDEFTLLNPVSKPMETLCDCFCPFEFCCTICYTTRYLVIVDDWGRGLRVP